MAKRSLQASPCGVKKAKQRFAFKGWTQEYLAAEVGIKTRQPIWRFFAGLPIERFIFFEICSTLDLDWRELCHEPPVETNDRPDLEFQSTSVDLETLVKMVRSQRQEKINHQCGILQLLDVSRPISIHHIYSGTNILEQIASQQWLEISTLRHLEPEDVDRLDLITSSQISGMQAVEKYSKLRILGRPGSGKSTFLKFLAIECNLGRFEPTKVPIFITLRDFAESYKNHDQVDLLKFIHQEFLTSDISHLAIIKKLLQGGKILLLIDGMDEIWHEAEHMVLNEIRRFSEKYHKNQFVVSCRTATQKLALKGFTDVEVAPFTLAQVTTFTNKWFVEFSTTNPADGLASASRFMSRLELSENCRFRRLLSTPLFLHLACLIFHRQEAFPTKLAEFYKHCKDLLLIKWDEAKGIDRDQIYRVPDQRTTSWDLKSHPPMDLIGKMSNAIYQGFMLPQKLKLLSQIALTTFEQGQYFFEQSVIEQHISDYIQALPNTSADLEEIQLASQTVLRSIEAHHGLLIERSRGIFSFPNLAFHEYFTARKIATSPTQELEQSLQGLVHHISDRHWRQIFLLTASMLRSSDRLVELMKEKIDILATQDSYLQEYLSWSRLKSPNYYEPNQLLLDCLNNSCHITASIKAEIEASLN
jgi:predicted NACHT family NTPase